MSKTAKTTKKRQTTATDQHAQRRKQLKVQKERGRESDRESRTPKVRVSTMNSALHGRGALKQVITWRGLAAAAARARVGVTSCILVTCPTRTCLCGQHGGRRLSDRFLLNVYRLSFIGTISDGSRVKFRDPQVCTTVYYVGGGKTMTKYDTIRYEMPF